MEGNLSAVRWCRAIEERIHTAVQRRATPERVAAWLARRSGADGDVDHKVNIVVDEISVGAWLAANLTTSDRINTTDTNAVKRLEKSCHAKI